VKPGPWTGSGEAGPMDRVIAVAEAGRRLFINGRGLEAPAMRPLVIHAMRPLVIHIHPRLKVAASVDGPCAGVPFSPIRPVAAFSSMRPGAIDAVIDAP
jgi:hypothetical protein